MGPYHRYESEGCIPLLKICDPCSEEEQTRRYHERQFELGNCCRSKRKRLLCLESRGNSLNESDGDGCRSRWNNCELYLSWRYRYSDGTQRSCKRNRRKEVGHIEEVDPTRGDSSRYTLSSFGSSRADDCDDIGDG